MITSIPITIILQHNKLIHNEKNDENHVNIMYNILIFNDLK